MSSLQRREYFQMNAKFKAVTPPELSERYRTINRVAGNWGIK
jgi:hypothetical protein